MPDLPIPSKFIYILLNPLDNYHNETIGIGRTFGALFSDEVCNICDIPPHPDMNAMTCRYSKKWPTTPQNVTHW